MLNIVALISCIKLLLIPSYRSTDFEVHRNWLAITHNLPIKKWYFEDTSEWTLDYPPIFAWFEYILSFFAQFFDSEMLVIENLKYDSPGTVLFQRLSVILTDLVYAYGARECSKALPKAWQSNIILPILLLCNVGLLMVDHIHFQYNGIMFGILLLSIAKMMKDDYLWAAFWFTFLINMKHIYVYLAPAYFIYLLRNYCLPKTNNKTNFAFLNLVKLAFVVLGVFLVTFLPFYDQLPQVFSRMFPFKRGLCHAYWAPNIWALYNIIDKLAIVLLKLLRVDVVETTASMTGGLVREFSHTVLPNVKPVVTVLLTGLFMLPGMVKLWLMGRKQLNFVRFLVLCALTSFLFGWHVHEKAILMAVIPLSVLAILDGEDAKTFVILSTVGSYSLFPLLFPANLTLLKAVLLIIYSSYSFYSLCNLYPLRKCKFLPLINLVESLYIFGLVPLFVYENVIHPSLGLNAKLPFLPLMMTSVYCAIGVVYTWATYYVSFVRRRE